MTLSEAQQLAVDMGLRLRWVREALGYSMRQFAADLGLDEATIRKIEKGERGPSVQLIATMCHDLGITPQYLFYGDAEHIDRGLREALRAKHPELAEPAPPRPAGKRHSIRKNPSTRSRQAKAPWF